MGDADRGDRRRHARLALARTRARRPPDGLVELIEAGLLAEGEQVVLDEHTATVRAGGVLHHGPDEFAVSTVNALATHLCGYTANGWHLWRRAHDNRLLADLRTELVRR